MWIPIIIPFGLRGRTKVVDNQVRTCTNCHNRGVQLVHNDDWFHLFFVPIVKVNRGIEYLHCPSCGMTVPYSATTHMPNFNDPNDVQFEPEKSKHKKGKYDGAPKPYIPPEYMQQQQRQPGYMDYNFNQEPVDLNKQPQQQQQQPYYPYQEQQNEYKQPNNQVSNENINNNNNNNNNGEVESDKKEKKHFFFKKHKKEKEKEIN